MAHDVFVSYSSKDKAIADAVCAKLEEHKVRVWIAPRDVPAGSNFAESIVEAIDTCKVVVLIWSADTNTSEHILNEVNQAFDQGITIIPFRIQDVQPTRAMRYYIGRTHWLDAIDPPLEDHIATLRNTILAILGRREEPAPAIPPLPAQATSVPVPAPAAPAAQSPDLAAKDAQPAPRGEALPTAAGKAPSAPRLKVPWPALAGGLAALLLAILFLTGVLKLPRQAPGTASIPSLTASASPAETTKPPTATPAPQLPAALPDPVLLAIRGQQPDFADDFSSQDNGWFIEPDLGHCSEPDQAVFRIAEGVLEYGTGPKCRIIRLMHPNLSYSNYALQVDIDFGSYKSNWRFDQDVETPPETAYKTWMFVLNGSGHYQTEIWDSISGDFQVESPGPLNVSPESPHTLTVIKQGGDYLLYLDALPLSSYTVPMTYDRPMTWSFTVERTGDDLGDPETIKLDDIKVWDLDKMFIPDRALSAVRHQPPDFADEFSAADTGWVFEVPPEAAEKCPDPQAAQMRVAFGVMQLSLDPGCRESNLSLGSRDLNYASYILQADLDFRKAPRTGLEFRPGVPEGIQNPPLAFFIRGDGSWQLGDDLADLPGGIKNHGKFNPAKRVKVTLITRGKEQWVYLDSTLVTVYNHRGSYDGPVNLNFHVTSEGAAGTEMLELDNLKIWVPDKLFIPERALSAIQSQPPDFTDDFSTADPAWVFEERSENRLQLCPNPDAAPMEIAEGVVRLSISPDCQQKELFSQKIVGYSGYILQMDINFNQTSHVIFGIEPGTTSLAIDINGDGSWGIGSVKSVQLTDTFDTGQPLRVTMILTADSQMVYFGSTLAAYVPDLPDFAQPLNLYFHVYPGDNILRAAETLTLDNISIWDLEKLVY